MYKMEVIRDGNRLDVSYEGDFEFAEAKQFYAQAQELAPKLKKGFIIVANLSFLEYMDVRARHFIEKTMDVLNNAGVSKVIRIIPDRAKDIGFNIMSLFHYSSHVELRTFKSASEAQEYLKKNGS